MPSLSDHYDIGGFCGCCGTFWPCAELRRAFLAQRQVLASLESPETDPETD
jgi:hypothetical protein